MARNDLRPQLHWKEPDPIPDGTVLKANNGTVSFGVANLCHDEVLVVFRGKMFSGNGKIKQVFDGVMARYPECSVSKAEVKRNRYVYFFARQKGVNWGDIVVAFRDAL